MFGEYAFTEIFALYCENRCLNDDDLQLLRCVPNLRELHLGSSGITDAGIPRILFLRQLTVLDLSSTRISEVGIRQLSACSNLRELDLSGTPMNDTLAEELKLALPNCDIFW